MSKTIVRDGYKRPIILDPPDRYVCKYETCKSGGSSRHGHYTRLSSATDALDDKAGLKSFWQRCVAAGILRRPDLAYQAAQLDPLAPDGWRDVLDAAYEAGGGYQAARAGTDLHEGTECFDKYGTIPTMSTQALQVQLQLYISMTSNFTWYGREVFGVVDEYGCAGTTDMVGHLPGYTPEGLASIADLKTNADLSRSGLAYAGQLAGYALMQDYDPETGERGPLCGTAIDQEAAWILNFPVKRPGEAGLYRVDLERGREFLKLADQVRNARQLAKDAIVRVA